MNARKNSAALIRLLIAFNLLLAVCAVWCLQRLTPPLRQIYTRNVDSLDACDNMLAAASRAQIPGQDFQDALDRAAANVTEQGEQQAIDDICAAVSRLHATPSADTHQRTIDAILRLAAINRAAIADEAARATRLRQAGAWTIVLLTLAFFAAALLLAARLRQQLLVPVEDIADVLDAHAAGDPFRRCRTASLDDSDMRQLCERLNSLLDQSARHP